MPTNYIVPSRPTATPMTGRPIIQVSNTMPVLITGLWDDTLLWDDLLYWNDNWNSTWTIYTTRPLI